METPETMNKHKALCDMKSKAYNCLVGLADLDDNELTSDEYDNATKAVEVIMHYGTYHDAVEALSYYFDYNFAVNQLHFM